MRLGFRAITLAAFSAITLCAGTLSITSGTLTATGVVFDTGGLALDVRGIAQITAFDGATPLGAFLFTDSTGGTDPGFTTLPFGNSTLLDFGATAGTSAITTLDFTTVVASGSNLFIAGTTSTPTGADGGLQSLFQDNPVVLEFGLSGAPTLGNGFTVVQWNLLAVAPATTAPEPATGLIFVAGMGVLLTRRRRAVNGLCGSRRPGRLVAIGLGSSTPR